jgi:hypothetical protein
MTVHARTLVLFTGMLLGGCLRQLPGSYACKVSSQCVLNGVPGVCEPSGACSFPDPGCASGRRYGDFDPGGLAGMCVATAATVADLAVIRPPATRDMAMGSGPAMITRGSTSQVGSGGGMSVPLPAGVAAGDLLVLSVYAKNMAATIAAPTGWMQQANLPGPDFSAAWFYKLAGASEPATIGFTVSGSTASAAACVAYRGVSPAVPIDASMTRLFTGAQYVVPSVATSHAGDRLLAMFIDETTSLAQPAGMTNVLTDNTIVFFDEALTASGASGDKSASSLPGAGAVDVIALTPAP